MLGKFTGSVGIDSMVGLIDDSSSHSPSNRHHDDPTSAALGEILARRGLAAPSPPVPTTSIAAAQLHHLGAAVKPPRPPSGGPGARHPHPPSRPTSGAAARPSTAAARCRPPTAAALRALATTDETNPYAVDAAKARAIQQYIEQQTATLEHATAEKPQQQAHVASRPLSDSDRDDDGIINDDGEASDRSRNCTPPPLQRRVPPPLVAAASVGVCEAMPRPLPSWAPRHADVAGHHVAEDAVVERSLSPCKPARSPPPCVATPDAAGLVVAPPAIPRPSTAAARVCRPDGAPAAKPRSPPPRYERRARGRSEDAAKPPGDREPLLTASTLGAAGAVPAFMKGKTVFDRVAATRPASARRPAAAASAAAAPPSGTADGANAAETPRTSEPRPAAWNAARGRANAADAARAAREKVRPPPATARAPSSTMAMTRRRSAAPGGPRLPFLDAKPSDSYLMEASYVAAVAQAKAAVKRELRADAVAASAKKKSELLEAPAAAVEVSGADRRRSRMQGLFLGRAPSTAAARAKAAAEVAAAEEAAVAAVGKSRATAPRKRATAQLQFLTAAQRAAVEADAANVIRRWWKRHLGLQRGRAQRREARDAVEARVRRADVAAVTVERLRGACRRYLRDNVFNVKRRLGALALQALWRGHVARRHVAQFERPERIAAAAAVQSVERELYAVGVIASAWHACTWRRRDRTTRALRTRGTAYRLQRAVSNAYATTHRPAFLAAVASMRRTFAARRIQMAWHRYATWRDDAADTFRRRFNLA